MDIKDIKIGDKYRVVRNRENCYGTCNDIIAIEGQEIVVNSIDDYSDIKIVSNNGLHNCRAENLEPIESNPCDLCGSLRCFPEHCAKLHPENKFDVKNLLEDYRKCELSKKKKKDFNDNKVALKMLSNVQAILNAIEHDDESYIQVGLRKLHENLIEFEEIFFTNKADGAYN
jgi:hypothetical protein